jgi:transposase
MTIELSFTPEIIAIVNEERYRHPLPIVQRRMEALWLKSHGLPHAQIAKLVNITENTLRDYFQLYLEGGLEKIREVHFYRPESQLMEHFSSLEAYFRAHPPATIREAQSVIAELTGIRRSASQVREFLKKNCNYGARRSG